MEAHFADSELVENKTRLQRIVDGLMAKREFLQSHINELSKTTATDEIANFKKELESIEKELQQYKGFVDKVTGLDDVSNRLTKQPLYYSDYLCLDMILNAQRPESAKSGTEAHHEMLFIIIHQAFELWFKQILHELTAVIERMNRDYVPEKDMSIVLHHIDRVVEIQKLLIKQFDVLETLTPLDFMDFRDFLFPASGFQSWQFRLLENVMGLQSDKRVQYERKSYHTRLSEVHQKVVKEAEEGATLFHVIERWLERTPFLKNEAEKFDFLDHYKSAAEAMFEEDKKVVNRITQDIEISEERQKEIHKIEENKINFLGLFDEQLHNEQIAAGSRRLSYKATQAALLIFIFQDEPVLHLPFKLLERLIFVDELFTSWRYKHSMMVHRMIGTKVGTGGSSGYWYLRSTIERGRVFADISNLSTYLIPRSDVPPLPEKIRKKLGFAHSSDDE